jgi:nucleoside 2-deoxyribosyltransferase
MTHFYVIMPVGADKEFAEKKAIIQEMAHKENLDPYFPFDKTGNAGFNIDSTLKILRNSEFVLADLSMERPSCYFELGLAQAIGKDVCLIAKRDTDIHQVQGRNLVRFYTDLQDYGQVISEVFKEAKASSETLFKV